MVDRLREVFRDLLAHAPDGGRAHVSRGVIFSYGLQLQLQTSGAGHSESRCRVLPPDVF